MKRVWMVCPKGHEYEKAAPERQPRHWTACPDCGRKAVVIRPTREGARERFAYRRQTVEAWNRLERPANEV